MNTEKLEQSAKRVYVTPRLIVHGTIEEITALQNKSFGASDGFLFQGVPISNVS
jgi:hypothetical protein